MHSNVSSDPLLEEERSWNSIDSMSCSLPESIITGLPLCFPWEEVPAEEVTTLQRRSGGLSEQYQCLSGAFWRGLMWEKPMACEFFELSWLVYWCATPEQVKGVSQISWEVSSWEIIPLPCTAVYRLLMQLLKLSIANGHSGCTCGLVGMFLNFAIALPVKGEVHLSVGLRWRTFVMLWSAWGGKLVKEDISPEQLDAAGSTCRSLPLQ